MSTSITENTPLISNEQGVTQVVATEEQKKQVRYLYLVHFLSTISISIVSTLLFIFIEVAQIGNETIKITTNNLPNLKFATLVISSIPWGILADKVGRKKVLNVLLLGSALFGGLFGYCKTINSATFIAFLIGAFSCSYIIIKTMIAESSIKSHRAYYFTRFIIITFVAYIIGSVIGMAFLASLLNRSRHFNITIPENELPYKIPCLIASIISIIAATISQFCLDETLGNKINEEISNSTNSVTQQSDDFAKSESTAVLGLAISKDSNFILDGFCLSNIIFTGFATVLLNWATDEVNNGGLNLNQEHVIIIIGVTSLIASLSIFLYPSLHRKYGSFKLYKAIFLPTTVVFIICSILSLIAKTGDTSLVLTLFAAILLTLGIFRIIQEISLDLLLIDSSKSTNNLATLFSISSVIVIILNCPSIHIILFNILTKESIPSPLKFNLVWILLALISYSGYRYTSKRNLN